MYDVIIIGSGIIGAGVARELSRYKANILVIDKENDVSIGTTKANSGIVHAGHDAKPGSNKAKFNVEGSKAYKALSKELDFPYVNNGAFVLGFSESDLPTLVDLQERGIVNGVGKLPIISGDEARALEPNISKDVVYALEVNKSAIVSPFEVCIAFAENAATNGVKFIFNSPVQNVTRKNGIFSVQTDNSSFDSLVVINCAGVYADEINNKLSEKKYHITPKRGDYFLLDKEFGGMTKRTLFQCPTKAGKGVLVSPTAHGNLLVGPSADIIDDREDKRTDGKILDSIWEKAKKTMDSIPKSGLITEFSGIRAHEDGSDFVIGFAPDVKGFYNCLGIESPGLASAPGIVSYAAKEVGEFLNLSKNPDFISKRTSIKHVANMSDNELEKLFSEDKSYAHIVCRCEVVSEGEIRESIRRVPGAKDLDGVKRRTRAGMGRCQSSFCAPKIMEILAEELGADLSLITKNGKSSRMLVGRCKDND